MSVLLGGRRPYSHLEDEDDFLRHEVASNRRTICRNRRRVAAGLAASFIGLTVVLAASVITLPAVLRRLSAGKPAFSTNEKVYVRTKCATFIGEKEGGAYVFRGIPYARPPVGNFRWRKPVPFWKEEENCAVRRNINTRNFGLPCFQLNPYTRQYEGSENCLYLNVWTPSLEKEASLDVMVWIHGGFLQFGSGHQPGLSPSGRLSKHLNIVFVSFNYRLHALGFLALDLLEPDRTSYGNYGFWDQVMALRWVSSHIRNFGGDPDKVTIFGADVGGASILAFTASSETRGLFRSAWLIGPSMIFNRSLEDVSRREHAIFLERTGCGQDSDCLRRLTPKEVIATYLGKDDPSFRVRDQNDLPIQGIYPEQLSVIDGELIAMTPEDSFELGQAADIPMLLGTAAQAVDVWPGPDDVHRWNWNQYKKYVTTSLDSFKPKVSQLALRIYNASLPIENPVTPEYVYTTMVSDVRQTCPISDLAELLARSSTSPIYRYIVTSRPSKPARIYDYSAVYSFHMWDAVSFFDQQEHYVGETSKEDLEFRDTLQSAVMDFVRSAGTISVVPGWSTYPTNVAIFSDNVTVSESYSRTKCKFWDDQGLHVYTWVS